MKIYITHSRDFDFVNELYIPFRTSILNQEHEITLPHEQSDKPFNSKEYMKTCDLVIAEVSFPSTGQGIELGWANMYELPVICIYRDGNKISGSLHVIANTFLAYKDKDEMLSKIIEAIKEISHK